LKQNSREVFLPLSHPPGEAQVDFGFADVLHSVELTKSGELTKVALFVMTMSYSDAIFMQAFPRECTESFLEGQHGWFILIASFIRISFEIEASSNNVDCCLHKRAFEFFSGVPNRISYDNSKIAVARITGSGPFD